MKRGVREDFHHSHFFPEATSGFGCKRVQVGKSSGNNCAHSGEAQSGRADRGPLPCLHLCGDRDCLPSVVLGIVSM